MKHPHDPDELDRRATEEEDEAAYQKRYQRERQRRIDDILREERERDLLCGGQGRTPADLRRDATGVVFALVLLFLLAIALIVGGAS